MQLVVSASRDLCFIPARGGSRGGRGPGGQGGPPNFIKREQNVVRVRMKTPRFST